MQNEWSQRPPVHHLVASYLGYKGAARSGFRATGDAEVATFENVMEEFGSVVSGSITTVKAPQ